MTAATGHLIGWTKSQVTHVYKFCCQLVHLGEPENAEIYAELENTPKRETYPNLIEAGLLA